MSKGEHKQRVFVIIHKIINGRSHYLLGRRGPNSNNAGQLNFFGGGVEPGETLEQAAVRELWEETRLIADESKLRLVLKDLVGKPKKSLKHVTWFLIQAKDLHFEHVSLTEETTDYEWVSLSYSEIPGEQLHYSVKHFLEWIKVTVDSLSGRCADDVAFLQMKGYLKERKS